MFKNPKTSEHSEHLATLDANSIDRIIGMAWEDRTSFEAIERQFGLSQAQVIRLLRSHMQRSSFLMWRKRVSGRKTKHEALRSTAVMRFKSSDQKNRD